MLDQIPCEASELANGLGNLALFGSDVIVAGASGLVGQYVVQALSAVNRISDTNANIWAVSTDGGALRHQRSDIRPVAVDLRSPCAQLDALPRKASCLIFAAGYGQPGKFLNSPLDPLAVNVTGLNSLISHLVDGAPVLYISSSEVYSGLEGPPFEEWQIGTTNPAHARAPYIEAKRAGEAITLAATGTGRIRGSVARLALAYGPGTRRDDSRVLNEFIRGAMTSGQIRMRDPGAGMRTYCYVKDAVAMMLWLVSQSKLGVFNVGGESRISIRDLAGLIATKCGADVYVPEESFAGSPGAPDDVWLSLDKIRGEGYVGALTPLEDGLDHTIAWQRRHLYGDEARK